MGHSDVRNYLRKTQWIREFCNSMRFSLMAGIINRISFLNRILKLLMEMDL